MVEKVDQDVREARRWMGKLPRDQFDLLLLLMREREAAGRQQGLREAAEVAGECPVQYATVRDGGDEWHIECRFKDGQKFAAVTVDKDHEDLADWIAAAITALIEGEGR